MKLTDKQKKLGLTTALLVALGFNLSLPMMQNLSTLELASKDAPAKGGDLPAIDPKVKADVRKEDPNLMKVEEIQDEPKSVSKKIRSQTITTKDGDVNIVYEQTGDDQTTATVAPLNSEGTVCTSCGVRKFVLDAPFKDIRTLDRAMVKQLGEPRHQQVRVEDDGDDQDQKHEEASEKALKKVERQCRGETTGESSDFDSSRTRTRYADERYDGRDSYDSDDESNFESSLDDYRTCAAALVEMLKKCVGNNGNAVSCSKKNPLPVITIEDAKEFFMTHLSTPLRRSLSRSSGKELLEKTKVAGDLIQDIMADIPMRYENVRRAAKDLGVQTVNAHRKAFERSASEIRAKRGEAEQLRVQARAETNPALRSALELQAQMIDQNAQNMSQALGQYSTMFNDRQYGILGMLESRLRTGLDTGVQDGHLETTLKTLLLNEYLRGISQDKSVISSLIGGNGNAQGGASIRIDPNAPMPGGTSTTINGNRGGRGGAQFAPAGQVPGQPGVRIERQSIRQ